MLLHLEFYSAPPAVSVRACQRIAFGTTSVDLAIVHAREVLENKTFSFGLAKFCLIKNEEGKVLCQMRARKLRPGK